MSDVLPVFHFDTAGLSAAAALEAWASVLPWFELDRTDSSDTFHVFADAWLLDGMVLSVTRTPPVALRRSPALIADGRTDYCVIAAAVPWSLQIGAGPATLVVPGEVCILDSGLPFRVETRGGEVTILNLPRPMLSNPELPATLHGARISNTLALVFGDFMQGLRARLPTLQRAQAGIVARALRDLLVSCLAAGIAPDWKSPSDRTVAHRAGHYIDGHLAAALSVADVARAMGVSRSRLYRIFAETGGVERLIMRRRLDRARTLLADAGGRRPGIAEVAHATGFASPTHFSRMFKATFGVTPTHARNMHISLADTYSPDDVQRFTSWFTTSPRD